MTKKIAFLLALLALCPLCHAQASFSFVYDGKPSSVLLPRWKHSVTPESQTWTDPRTGLQVECRIKSYPDFDVAEWELFFRNTGTRNTPQLREVHSLDLCQSNSGGAGEWQIHHADGPYFGRGDFRPLDTLLTRGGKLHLEPFGGRSSSHTMPYFNICTPTGGVVYGVGWTGSWSADMEVLPDGQCHVTAGLRDFDSYLKPGEEIKVASVFALRWEGAERMDGQNLLRRFILAHHHPYMNGKPIVPPLLNNFDHTGPWPCDEYSCMTSYLACAIIRQYQFLGTLVDGFWLDAGWYDRAGDWKRGYWWHSAVGNWTPDLIRFPDGLAPVSEQAHETGGKMLVWYEPERANVDSDWAHEHPEWMLAESGAPAVPLEEVVDSAFLVNMGDPDALKWVCDEMVKRLTDDKVDYYRQDFNIDPEMFWLNNDKPLRRGMTEVKYINGVYTYLDHLREKLPHLIIDNCAGGGRRLDFEMLSRSIVMWRSDYSRFLEGHQCHTYNLNQWLPVHCTATGNCTPYAYRSTMGTGGCLCWGITNRKNASISDELGVIAQLRDMQGYFMEDYYPLSGYGDNTGDDIWLAYQLHRRSDGSGRVVAFRRKECTDPSYEVRLRGLDPDTVYLLKWADDEMTARMSGRQLGEGLVLKLDEPRSSLLIRYAPDGE